MKRIDRVLLALLRAGLWEREVDEIELFPLSPEEWLKIRESARKQSIDAVVFEGICQLPDELMAPQALLEEWVVEVEQIEKANQRMNEVQASLLGLFHQNNIYPIVMKGQGIAQYYANPMSRVCGDIDLYLDSKDQYQKAINVICELGTSGTFMADNSFEFQWKGVVVELHMKLIDIYNPFHQKIINKLIQAEGFQDIYPTPLLNILLQITHILKHHLGHGIGLRQLADLARSYHVLHGQFDKIQCKAVIKQLGLKRWVEVLDAILEHALDVDSENVLFPGKMANDSGIVLNKILQGGNFGKYGNSRKSRLKNPFFVKINTAYALLKGWYNTRRIAGNEALWYALTLMKQS